MAITLGQRLDALVQHRLQKTHLDDSIHRFLPRFPAQAPDFSREIQKAEHGHVSISGRVFRQVTDQPPRRNRLLDDVEAADGHRSLRGWNEAGDHPHRGGFAGAVGAEKPQHLSAVHRKRNAIHGAFGAEKFGQILNFNHITNPIPDLDERSG